MKKVNSKRKLSLDYLGLRDLPAIIKFLRNNDESLVERTCYSDNIFLITESEQREPTIILLTGN